MDAGSHAAEDETPSPNFIAAAEFSSRPKKYASSDRLIMGKGGKALADCSWARVTNLRTESFFRRPSSAT